ncbi:hypothetical protein C0995_010890 [Termitomyces sp. Mi166|nr:hypothetical protein C0995_010890 [Termitomyces sp. Mi166\
MESPKIPTPHPTSTTGPTCKPFVPQLLKEQVCPLSTLLPQREAICVHPLVVPFEEAPYMKSSPSPLPRRLECKTGICYVAHLSYVDVTNLILTMLSLLLLTVIDRFSNLVRHPMPPDAKGTREVQYSTLSVQGHLPEQPLRPAIASIVALIDSSSPTRFHISEELSASTILVDNLVNSNIPCGKDSLPSESPVPSIIGPHEALLQRIGSRSSAAYDLIEMAPPSSLPSLETDSSHPLLIPLLPIPFTSRKPHEPPSKVHGHEELRVEVALPTSPSRMLTRKQYKQHTVKSLCTRQLRQSVEAAEHSAQRSSGIDANAINTTCVDRTLLPYNSSSICEGPTEFARDLSATPLDCFPLAQAISTGSPLSGSTILAKAYDTDGPESIEILRTFPQSGYDGDTFEPFMQPAQAIVKSESGGPAYDDLLAHFERLDKEDSEIFATSTQNESSSISVDAEALDGTSNEFDDQFPVTVSTSASNIPKPSLTYTTSANIEDDMSNITVPPSDRSLSGSIWAPKKRETSTAASSVATSEIRSSTDLSPSTPPLDFLNRDPPQFSLPVAEDDSKSAITRRHSLSVIPHWQATIKFVFENSTQHKRYESAPAILLQKRIDKGKRKMTEAENLEFYREQRGEVQDFQDDTSSDEEDTSPELPGDRCANDAALARALQWQEYEPISAIPLSPSPTEPPSNHSQSSQTELSPDDPPDLCNSVSNSVVKEFIESDFAVARRLQRKFRSDQIEDDEAMWRRLVQEHKQISMPCPPSSGNPISIRDHRHRTDKYWIAPENGIHTDNIITLDIPSASSSVINSKSEGLLRLDSVPDTRSPAASGFCMTHSTSEPPGSIVIGCQNLPADIMPSSSSSEETSSEAIPAPIKPSAPKQAKSKTGGGSASFWAPQSYSPNPARIAMQVARVASIPDADLIDVDRCVTPLLTSTQNAFEGANGDASSIISNTELEFDSPNEDVDDDVISIIPNAETEFDSYRYLMEDVDGAASFTPSAETGFDSCPMEVVTRSPTIDAYAAQYLSDLCDTCGRLLHCQCSFASQETPSLSGLIISDTSNVEDVSPPLAFGVQMANMDMEITSDVSVLDTDPSEITSSTRKPSLGSSGSSLESADMKVEHDEHTYHFQITKPNPRYSPRAELRNTDLRQNEVPDYLPSSSENMDRASEQPVNADVTANFSTLTTPLPEIIVTMPTPKVENASDLVVNILPGTSEAEGPAAVSTLLSTVIAEMGSSLEPTSTQTTLPVNTIAIPGSRNEDKSDGQLDATNRVLDPVEKAHPLQNSSPETAEAESSSPGRDLLALVQPYISEHWPLVGPDFIDKVMKLCSPKGKSIVDSELESFLDWADKQFLGVKNQPDTPRMVWPLLQENTSSNFDQLSTVTHRDNVEAQSFPSSDTGQGVTTSPLRILAEEAAKRNPEPTIQEAPPTAEHRQIARLPKRYRTGISTMIAEPPSKKQQTSHPPTDPSSQEPVLTHYSFASPFTPENFLSSEDSAFIVAETEPDQPGTLEVPRRQDQGSITQVDYIDPKQADRDLMIQLGMQMAGLERAQQRQLEKRKARKSKPRRVRR